METKVPNSLLAHTELWIPGARCIAVPVVEQFWFWGFCPQKMRKGLRRTHGIHNSEALFFDAWVTGWVVVRWQCAMRLSNMVDRLKDSGIFTMF